MRNARSRSVRASKPRISIGVSYLFLSGWLLVTLFPIFWMVSTSFKPPLGWFAWPPHWLPVDFTLDNYRQILTFGTLAPSTPDPDSGFTRLGLAVTFAFVFILNWSEFLLATTLAGQDLTMVTVQLSLYEQLLGPQAAFGTLAILPLIVLGFAVQKHLVTGFSYGLVRK